MTVGPEDITTALTTKHEEYEGEPPTPDQVHDMLVDLTVWTVDTAIANGEPEHRIIESIKNLALAAAKIDGYDKTGCDACGVEYDLAVLEAADAIIPPSSTQNDSNGDPDVTVCGMCIAEHDPHADEAEGLDMLAAEQAVRDLYERTDEADTIAGQES